MSKFKLRSQNWFNNPDNPGMTALYLERYKKQFDYYNSLRISI